MLDRADAKKPAYSGLGFVTLGLHVIDSLLSTGFGIQTNVDVSLVIVADSSGFDPPKTPSPHHALR
jgi:hypothetical protein